MSVLHYRPIVDHLGSHRGVFLRRRKGPTALRHPNESSSVCLFKYLCLCGYHSNNIIFFFWQLLPSNFKSPFAGFKWKTNLDQSIHLPNQTIKCAKCGYDFIAQTADCTGSILTSFQNNKSQQKYVISKIRINDDGLLFLHRGLYCVQDTVYIYILYII